MPGTTHVLVRALRPHYHPIHRRRRPPRRRTDSGAQRANTATHDITNEYAILTTHTTPDPTLHVHPDSLHRAFSVSFWVLRQGMSADCLRYRDRQDAQSNNLTHVIAHYITPTPNIKHHTHPNTHRHMLLCCWLSISVYLCGGIHGRIYTILHHQRAAQLNCLSPPVQQS